MKKILLFTILFLYTIINAQNSGIVEYGIKFTPIKKNKDPKSLEYFRKVEELIIELQFNNSFAHSKLLKPEPINDDDSILINIASIISGARGIYFTSAKDNTIINKKEFLGDIYLISSDINRDDWKISEEKIKIGKYNCLKATRELKYTKRGRTKKRIQEVWFTPQIPVMFGPGDFVGLPGLVLKVKEGIKEYTAQKIILNPSTKIIIKKPTKGKKVTNTEFQKIVKEEGGFLRRK